MSHMLEFGNNLPSSIDLNEKLVRATAEIHDALRIHQNLNINMTLLTLAEKKRARERKKQIVRIDPVGIVGV